MHRVRREHGCGGRRTPRARRERGAGGGTGDDLDRGSDRRQVVAHEWGTFTSVADDQGRPTEWLPLSGQSDLPCFVHYYQNREVKVLTSPSLGPVVNYRQARERLRGTVRMETPVIYFYAVGRYLGRRDGWFPAGALQRVVSVR